MELNKKLKVNWKISIFYLVPKLFRCPDWVKSIAHDPALNDITHCGRSRFICWHFCFATRWICLSITLDIFWHWIRDLERLKPPKLWIYSFGYLLATSSACGDVCSIHSGNITIFGEILLQDDLITFLKALMRSSTLTSWMLA